MKKILTLLLFIIVSLPVMSQAIVVEKNNGTDTSIEFDALDKITFSGTTVKIRQTDGTETSATMGEIRRITFATSIGIDDIDSDSRDFIRNISDDALTVNCHAGDIVTLYDMTGALLICLRQKSDNGTIGIAHLPRGVYIIKSNDHTAKFVKR